MRAGTDSLARIIILIILLTATAVRAQEYRDVVFLKNGSVIKGFYKELYPSDSLRMETIDGGVLVCAFTDIERIAKERTKIYVVNTQEADMLPPRVWRPKGYIGSVEYGRDINSSDSHIVITSMFTVHGYQFNPYFYFGLGFGIQHMEYEAEGLKLSFTESTIPLFADMKIHLLKTRIAPFVDGRLGYSVKGFKGFYLNPSAGVSFGISPRTGGYLGLGYSFQKLKGNDESDRTRLEGMSFRVGLFFYAVAGCGSPVLGGICHSLLTCPAACGRC